MSISKPSESARPTNKYIKFKNGVFAYWDKQREENVEVELPVKFLVLDELATITGWHDSSQSAIYSNEVHSTSHEELIVKAFKGGELVKGNYAEIKDKIKSLGGRYTKSVYALMNDELVNFHFVGASLSSWIGKETEDRGIEVKKLEEGKKGSTVYKFPVFEGREASQEERGRGVELDKSLQEYLGKYKEGINNGSIKSDTATRVAEARDEAEVEILPF